MWRKLLKVSWTEMKHNTNVINQEGENRSMFNIIRERSGQMFGHLLRHILFTTHIFEERINGHKGRGRPRKAFIK